MQAKHSALRKRVTTLTIGLLMVVLGLTVSMLAAVYQSHKNQTYLVELLNTAINTLEQDVTLEINRYEYGLRGARGSIAVAGKNGITRDLFRLYSQTRDIDHEFAGARGIGFIRRVPAVDQEAFIERARADGWPDFQLRQLAASEGERYIIQYVEPIARNGQAVGLDIASEPKRRQAADAATDNATPQLTGPITLVQASNAAQRAFLLLMPVYDIYPVPETVEARRKASVGWTYAALIIDEVVAKLQLVADQSIQLSDVTNPAAPQVFYTQGDFTQARQTRKKTLLLAGRQWELEVGSTPAMEKRAQSLQPAEVFVFGSLVSLLMGVVTGLIVERKRQQELLAHRQAMMAAIAENSIDAIIGQDLSGSVTHWNRGAALMFGFLPEEAIGKPLVDLIVPPHLRHEELRFLATAKKGESIAAIETVRRHKDTREIEVSASVSPVFGLNGVVLGVSKILHDLTLQNASKREIADVNEKLENLVSARTKALETSNALLESVLASAKHVAIVATDAAGAITLFNRGAETLLGYNASEMVGIASPLRFIVIDNNDRIEGLDANGDSSVKTLFEAVTRVALSVGVETLEAEYRRKDGSKFPVAQVISAMRNKQNQFAGFLFVSTDISALRDSEAALASSYQKTKTMLDVAPTPIVTINARGIMMAVNAATTRLFGYSEKELLGHNVSMLMPESESTKHDGYLDAFGARNLTASFLNGREVTASKKDGTPLPIHLAIGKIEGEEIQYVGVMSDLTVIRQQREELQQLRDQLLMAVEVARLGIWLWFIDDNTLQWNDLMFELYQQPVALRNNGLNYQHWYERVHPEDRDATAAKLEASVAGTGVYDPVFRIVRPDGSIRIIQGNARIICDNNGKPVEVIGINVDITEQKLLEEHLLKAKEQADAASVAKTQFLANMSHEIRTPLNATIGMLQILLKTPLSALQYGYAQKAYQAADLLLGLLNDVLDYSKIEAGKLELDLCPFNLDALLDELGNVFAANSAKNNELEVCYDIDGSIPEWLIGDSLRLKQVLLNLVGNAIKFTPAGHVLLSLKVINRLDKTVTIQFCVKDTGIGIALEKQATIFEAFNQADSKITRRFGGTGLGLVISQRLVNLMGSTLQLESNIGVGSRFWFDVAFEIDQANGANPLGKAIDSEKPLKIMTVDDNRVVGQILMRTLQDFGWQSDYDENAITALARVAKAQKDGVPYDAVVVDWKMPDIDGVEFAQQMKLHLGSMAPVVVMITGQGRELLSQTFEKQALFSEALIKPVTPRQLVLAIKNAMSGQPALAHKRTEHASMRLDGLNILVVEDNALNREVVTHMLVSEGARVHSAENGQQGVAFVETQGDSLDLLIMDMQMPIMDGLEATRMIRRDDRFAKLPILAMTANATTDDKRACIDVGMNDYISKPFDLELAIDIILKLTQRDATPALPPPNAIVRDAESTQPPIEAQDSILRRFGGRKDIFVKHLAAFEIDAQQMIRDVEAAVVGNDRQKAILVFHSLKGAAATLGALALSQSAAEFEKLLKDQSLENSLTALVQEGALSRLAETANTCFSALKDAICIDQQNSPVGTVPAPQVIAADANALSSLQALLKMLETGQLDAIEKAQSLTVMGLGGTAWTKTVSLIDSLSFVAAAKEVRQLIVELEAKST